MASQDTQDHLIPSDARLQRSVGGARTSLHVRVAKKILEEIPQWERAAVLRAHYRRVLASSADAPTFDRERLTDEQVERFIRAEVIEARALLHPGTLRFAIEAMPASSHGSKAFFTAP